MADYFLIERELPALLDFLPEIQGLADSERLALGFMPKQALKDAIERNRLIAAFVEEEGERHFAGYLLHSGVFPNAKVQQVAATPRFRKRGAASALMRALVSSLENKGFLSIRADVASDLTSALKFYASNGFERISERAGGVSRGRTIIVHSKQLDTNSLFDRLAPKGESSEDLRITHNPKAEIPVFAFDLNVYFDLVRNRTRSDVARKLFSEALGHRFRLVVADEFVAELVKTSTDPSNDPIFQMAAQLPRLPKQSKAEIDALAKDIHETVFVAPGTRGAGKKQAISDSKHIAHAVISKATAFVTQDGPILKARDELFARFGVDIATVEEILDLLPAPFSEPPPFPLHGDGFFPGEISERDFNAYLEDNQILDSVCHEFSHSGANTGYTCYKAVLAGDHVLGVAALQQSQEIGSAARILVHVKHEHPNAELFVEFFLDELIRSACRRAPTVVELVQLPGQSIVSQQALRRGFQCSENKDAFLKVAVGRPLISETWTKVSSQTRRCTGMVLPAKFPPQTERVEVGLPDNSCRAVRLERLEELLSPTVIVWSGRNGVMVPIHRTFADELLGTGDQPSLGLTPNRHAAFKSLRGYVNSPKAAKKMRPGSPIIFYESMKGNGRGVAVAVAKITSSVVVAKTHMDASKDSRLVVDALDGFSSTKDVLLTTFDNLMLFPSPVRYETLKRLKVTGGANLVSAVSLSDEEVSSILSLGWANGGT